MALDFIAGCLGGCAGIIVGYPLDTVKVHMQTQDYRNPKYRGTWHCLRSILVKESAAGLYRGMSSPMAGVAAVNAIVFGVYGQTQRRQTDPDTLSTHFLAGTYAGIAQTPISSPIELAKTRLQLQTPAQSQFTGPAQCLRHIYRTEGYRGVFKGVGITFLREAPSYGTYFLTYELLTRTSKNEPVSTPCMLLAGGLAGVASWVISYPVDVIKSRIQAERSDRYSGALDCLRKSVQSEGYACLYRGLSSTVLRAFPTNAATFAVVTWTFRLFGRENETTSDATVRPGLIETADRISGEPFLGKWHVYLKDAPYEQTFSRTCHAISPGLVLGTCRSDGYTEVPMKYGVVEQTRGLECRGTRPEGSKEDEACGDVDESNAEKKVETDGRGQTAERVVEQIGITNAESILCCCV